jgi:hypothetical protein
MLSQQLCLLEKCELVKRTVHPQFLPKVEYELTEFGKMLCPAMKTLVDTDKSPEGFVIIDNKNSNCWFFQVSSASKLFKSQLFEMVSEFYGSDVSAAGSSVRSSSHGSRQRPITLAGISSFLLPIASDLCCFRQRKKWVRVAILSSFPAKLRHTPLGNQVEDAEH